MSLMYGPQFLLQLKAWIIYADLIKCVTSIFKTWDRLLNLGPDHGKEIPSQGIRTSLRTEENLKG